MILKRNIDLSLILVFFTLILFNRCYNGAQSNNTTINLIENSDSNIFLKTLKIEIKNKRIHFPFDPFNNTVNITIPKSFFDFGIKIIAEANDKNTKITIGNNEESKNNAASAEYKPAIKQLQIKLQKGKIVKTYTLNLSEANVKTTIKLNLISFVGGSNVIGTTVQLFKRGEVQPIDTKITDEKGNVEFTVDSGNYYDFLALPQNDRASSRLENVYAQEANGFKKKLVLVQRIISVGSKALPLEILELKYAKEKGNKIYIDRKDINDNYVFSGNLKEQRGGIFIKLKCPSGEVIGDGNAGNFGIALNINCIPSSLSNVSRGIVRVGNIITENNGAKICSYFIPLSNIDTVSGNGLLFIAAYDLCGNRIEKHIQVFFEGKNNCFNNVKAKIKDFDLCVTRFPRPLYTFNIDKNKHTTLGLVRHESFESSYKTDFSFFVKDENNIDVPIIGYDIYRREYNTSYSLDEKWELVGKKLYSEPYAGFSPYTPDNAHRIGAHIGHEADCKIEEDKIYQYKIIARTDSFNFISSNIVNASILPPFLIKQSFPKAHQDIYEDDDIEISFIISNKSLWNKNKVDEFTFGLLISDATSANSVQYAAKLKYIFNAETPDDSLEIGIYNNTVIEMKSLRKIKEIFKDKKNEQGELLIPPTVTVNDLIKYDELKGEVTITKLFLSINNFNLKNPNTGLKNLLEASHSYFWDIQDWGNNAESIKDDRPAFFTKYMPLFNSNTGEKIANEKSSSISKSNLIDGANAINGRFCFNIIRR